MIALDRRVIRTETPTTNLARLNTALAGCVADLEEFPGDAGIAYSVAVRISRINDELVALKARDLLCHRSVTP